MSSRKDGRLRQFQSSVESVSLSVVLATGDACSSSCPVLPGENSCVDCESESL